MRSRRISLDLMGFQVIFARELQILPVFVSFHQKSFEYRRRFLVLWSGRVARVLGEETRQPTQRVSGFVGSDPQPTSEWSVWAVFGLGLGGLVGSLSWVDSPTHDLDWVAKWLVKSSLAWDCSNSSMCFYMVFRGLSNREPVANSLSS